MRTIIINGVPATIFDEKTHPLGLEYKKQHNLEEAVVVKPIVVVAKPTIAQKVVEAVKKKK